MLLMKSKMYLLISSQKFNNNFRKILYYACVLKNFRRIVLMLMVTVLQTKIGIRNW